MKLIAFTEHQLAFKNLDMMMALGATNYLTEMGARGNYNLKKNNFEKIVSIPSISGVRIYISLAIIVLSYSSSIAASIPRSLFEHTITVTWQEAREDRLLPDGQWHEVNSYRSSHIYVSSVGRVFRREKTINVGYGQRRGSKRTEGSLDGNVNGGADFSGNNLIITVKALEGQAARRTVISFDQDFRSCIATIITGKSDNTPSFVQRAIVGGGFVEVRSVHTSSVSCSVTDGNNL